MGVDPLDERLDAVARRGDRQQPAAAALGLERIVDLDCEQQSVPAELFQHPHCRDYLRDCHPGSFAYDSSGLMIAVLVAGDLELPGIDEV
ncbi:hypothetical protein ACFXMT_50650, partial [Streptomyces mirabilis]|uniref:hypothetical protein n=1 Tax=Streptomyces mirabilis TaxID=68239 RepID=UPI0036D1238B